MSLADNFQHTFGSVTELHRGKLCVMPANEVLVQAPSTLLKTLFPSLVGEWFPLSESSKKHLLFWLHKSCYYKDFFF